VGVTNRCPVTVVVLTFNEERNLRQLLQSISGWAQAIFVVDSGSADRTLAIAAEFDALVVNHPFETHARQWRWALDHLPIETEWILALDADQRLTPELQAAITTALESPSDTAGFFLARRQIFRGRWIRHGGYYPKYLLKLFRRDRVSIDERDLVDHHFTVDGPLATLGGDLIEDNQNEASIFDWTTKHNRYAVLQARHELSGAAAHVPFASLFQSPDARVAWLKQLWRRLPLFVRPSLYVWYRYVLRLGFLDGKQGFIFHVLQGFWYRLLVDINIDEIRAAAPVREASAPAVLPANGAESEVRRV